MKRERDKKKQTNESSKQRTMGDFFKPKADGDESGPTQPKRPRMDADDRVQAAVELVDPPQQWTPQVKTGSNVRSTAKLEKEKKLNLDFLDKEHILDMKQRRPDHPDYDSTTLYVPKHIFQSCSEGHKQWWNFKAGNADTILFFKVGKFYELYYQDAEEGIEVLGLQKMKGEFPHCGFPESSCDDNAQKLIARGYKVARIEQTETPAELAERNKSTPGGKKEKVVKRELCQIQSISTNISFAGGGSDQDVLEKEFALPKYLLAIMEMRSRPLSARYGVCFVDCSTAKFQSYRLLIKLADFEDDENQSTLRTLLAHCYPAEVLYQRGTLSKSTLLILKTVLADVPQQVFPSKGFMPREDVIAMPLLQLMSAHHLGPIETWPDEVRSLILDRNSTLPRANESNSLAVCALGGVLVYLKRCQIDVDMTSMKLFTRYVPPNLRVASPTFEMTEQSQVPWAGRSMVLDGTSLCNLHILPLLSPSLSRRGGGARSEERMSLVKTVDYCSTSFGRRLLREWISAPTCDPSVLQRRQECIDFLINGGHSFAGRAMEILSKIPDLPRLFQRIHSNSLQYRATEHPDSRANFFGADYSKRKVECFLKVLDGLEGVRRIVDLYGGGRNHLLDSLIGDQLPDFSSDLDYFTRSFDLSAAKKEGVIVPVAGEVPDYDDALRLIGAQELELERYLDGERGKLGRKDIRFHQVKSDWQLEVPAELTLNEKQYESRTCTKKGSRRYSTKELQRLAAELDKANQKREAVIQDVARRMFADFDHRRQKWSHIVKSIAALDVLCSLSKYACAIKETDEACFPQFDFSSAQPYLEIEGGVHPCFSASQGFVPNNCRLGAASSRQQVPSVLLLTGPNMGGKSTLMRTVSLLTVLAQIGSMVPAKLMRLTPCDRIFCRVGASDRLSAGQSTFYVELAETNIIIKQATRNSLVIIDELGRGTSTHDGVSIAASALKHISERIQCRMIFSTHYHRICEMVKDNSHLKLAHMAYEEEEDGRRKRHEALSKIIFLYTLRDGSCRKSYGYFTAGKAGIPDEIIIRAHEASKLYLKVGTGGSGRREDTT